MPLTGHQRPWWGPRSSGWGLILAFGPGKLHPRGEEKEGRKRRGARAGEGRVRRTFNVRRRETQINTASRRPAGVQPAAEAAKLLCMEQRRCLRGMKWSGAAAARRRALAQRRRRGRARAVSAHQKAILTSSKSPLQKPTSKSPQAKKPTLSGRFR